MAVVLRSCRDGRMAENVCVSNILGSSLSGLETVVLVQIGFKED